MIHSYSVFFSSCCTLFYTIKDIIRQLYHIYTGTLQYPLKAIDQEGDQVLFYLNSSETYDMGTPTLTVEGL